jgi:hypothetical protein
MMLHLSNSVRHNYPYVFHVLGLALQEPEASIGRLYGDMTCVSLRGGSWTALATQTLVDGIMFFIGVFPKVLWLLKEFPK